MFITAWVWLVRFNNDKFNRMDSDKIIKLANKVMIELLKKDLPNNEINDLIDLVDEIRIEALTIPVVVGQSEQLVAFLKWVGDGYDFENNAEKIVKEYIDEGN